MGQISTSRTTALQKFSRLETIGRWRASPKADPVEVVISFGEASIILADGDGRPFTHWSLPAVKRLNEGEMPALYGPDGDAYETLEIDDQWMVEALDTVESAIIKNQPKSGALRRRVGLGVLAVAAGLAVFWAPGALKRQAIDVVPIATRQEIGATILGLLQRETGPVCRAPAGVAALDRLVNRLFGARSGISAVVLPEGETTALPHAARLPGNLIVVPKSALAASDDPYVFAGDLLSAWAAFDETDPMRPVLDASGIWGTLTLLGTGRLPATPLAPLAHKILTEGYPTAEPEALAAAFASANLPMAPWASAQEGGSAPFAPYLSEIDPDEVPNVISDLDWVALQGICLG